MFIHYKSVAEFKALATYDYTQSYNQGRITSSVMGRQDASFLGLPSAIACIEALTEGYPIGMEKVHDTLATLRALPRAIGISRMLVHGAMGDELDIHAVNRGAITTAWTSRKRLIRKTTANIRIIVDICGNSSTSANQLLWRGVAGLALSNILTKAKYKTEIIGAIGVKHHIENIERTDCIAVTIKPFGITADENLLASTLCLAGFFRTLGFCAIVKQADDENRNVTGGFGNSTSVENLYPVAINCYQITIPQTINSKYDCEKWLTETIKLIEVNR